MKYLLGERRGEHCLALNASVIDSLHPHAAAAGRIRWSGTPLDAVSTFWLAPPFRR